jgi:predicted DNA-binding protein (MmcQ/YjbR family)
VTLEDLRTWCLGKPGASSDFPFDATTEVFRVCGKIFALVNVVARPLIANLKGDPELNPDLRQTHPEITPGYHMNKRHWNSVNFEGAIGDDKLTWLIDHSYECVKAKLPKPIREGLL